VYHFPYTGLFKRYSRVTSLRHQTMQRAPHHDITTAGPIDMTSHHKAIAQSSATRNYTMTLTASALAATSCRPYLSDSLRAPHAVSVFLSTVFITSPGSPPSSTSSYLLGDDIGGTAASDEAGELVRVVQCDYSQWVSATGHRGGWT